MVTLSTTHSTKHTVCCTDQSSFKQQFGLCHYRQQPQWGVVLGSATLFTDSDLLLLNSKLNESLNESFH